MRTSHSRPWPKTSDPSSRGRWSRARYPALVILLQTAFTDIDTGDFRVLYKPFDPQMFLSAIRELLGTRDAPR
jgi:hypothetical protein